MIAAIAQSHGGDSMLPASLDVVTLVSDDVSRLARFYAGLGWPGPADPRPDHAFVRTGGAVLALWTAAEAEPEIAAPLRRLRRAFRGVTLAVSVTDRESVDAALDAARAAGAPVVAEASDRAWGGRSGYFCDPDGNPWEVAWVPGSRRDAAGRLVLPA
jgi:uncharacterized protein